MSQRALCLAVRDHLRTVLGLDENSCEVGFDGEPKPACGETYVAVWPGTWDAGQHGDNDLDEHYSVNVTLTRRIGYSPGDRWGVEVLFKESVGMEPQLRKVLTALHVDWRTVLQIANESYLKLAAPWAGGLVERLEFKGGGRPELKGPDWFNAVTTDSENVEVGVAQTMMFGGVRRLQGNVGYTVT